MEAGSEISFGNEVIAEINWILFMAVNASHELTYLILTTTQKGQYYY